MHCRAEVLFMQLIQHFFGIRENPGIPVERSVLCIPSRRTKSSTEVDHGVTWQLLFAEQLCFRDDFFTARQCAMRLLIAKTPQRRHLRESSEPCILTHQYWRLSRRNEEQIERK